MRAGIRRIGTHNNRQLWVVVLIENDSEIFKATPRRGLYRSAITFFEPHLRREIGMRSMT